MNILGLFMNTKFITSLCALGIMTTCLAQTIPLSEGTNWGAVVHGTRLSISITNYIASIGSTITLTEQIRNRSRDTVWLEPYTLKSYVLSNHLGEIYYLIPSYDLKIFLATPKEQAEAIVAGETKEWSVRFKIKDQIAVGDYQLKDMRVITVKSNESYSIVSNVLGLKVVK